MSDNQSTSNGRTYVLVHGAWHGGWVWKDVSDQLTDYGHRVTTPTLTGLGERAHLVLDDVGLDTHVNDIVQHIQMENLTNVVLLGWSYGGMVVTGVISIIPDRILSVIYLDAFVPEDGKALVDYATLQIEPIQDLLKAGERLVPLPQNAYQDRWNITEQAVIDSAVPRLTPQPIESFIQSVKAPLGLPKNINYTYIKLNGDQLEPFMQFYEQALSDLHFETEKVEDGHMIMLTNPGKLVALLLDVK